MESGTNNSTEQIVNGVNAIVSTPILAIPFSIISFILGIIVFKRGMANKNVEDYRKIKSLGTGIGLFILSIALIINTILTLTGR